MKDFNLNDLFCEILSGFFALSVSILILDVAGYYNLDLLLHNFKLDFSQITVLVAIGYFIGLIVDAIGLALGEWFLDNFFSTNKEPERMDVKNFYSNASESIVKYRDNQWAYYSLYRNIFVLIIIGFPFYVIKVWREIDWIFSIVTSLLIIGVLIALFYSMRALINLYYDITKNIL